jgi:hypothetical protein
MAYYMLARLILRLSLSRRSGAKTDGLPAHQNGALHLAKPPRRKRVAFTHARASSFIARMKRRKRKSPPRGGVSAKGAAADAAAVGAGAVGALTSAVVLLGAVAIGAVAVGAFAIGRLSVRRASITHLSVGDLDIDRLHVRQVARTRSDKPR